MSDPFSYGKSASIPFLAHGMMEATIYSVLSSGWVYITVPRQTGMIIRGPFPILMTPRAPVAGDRALIGFMEGKTDEIVVLGIFGMVGEVISLPMGTCVVYNVLDAGVVANSAGAASANVTALRTIETSIQAAGCGIIYFPCGTYSFDGDSTPFLTVDTDNVTIAAEAGVGATLHDLRTTAGTFIKYSGASGNYISNCAIRDIAFTGVNGGANSRKAVELSFVEGMKIDRSSFTDSAYAIWGEDVKDCLVSFTTFTRCSTSDATNKAAVYLSSDSGSSKVSRSTRFTDCTWKDCYQHDVFLDGVVTPVSHIKFSGCRFQNDGYIRGDRLRLSLVENVSFKSCEWSLGDFHTGYTTKINAVAIEGTSTAVSFIDNFFEAQGVASGSASLSTFIYGGVGSDNLIGLTMIDTDFVIGANNAPVQACVRYGTVVSKTFRAGNRIISDAVGGVLLETGTPTTLSSRGVATLGHLIAPTRAVTAATSVTQDDDVILCNANSASFIVTLPSIATSPYRIAIKKTDSSANIVRVTPTGATVEGVSTLDLANQYECVTLVHDGTNWWIT